MRTRPLLALALAFAGGCLVGEDVSPSAVASLLGLSGALLVLSVAVRPGREGWSALGLGAAALALAAAGAGVERAHEEATPLRSFVEAPLRADEPVELRGVAAEDGRALTDRYLLLLDVESVTTRGREAPLWGRARIEVGGVVPKPEIVAGDRLLLWAYLRPPHGFGTPGAPDAVAQARHEGIAARGYCKSFLLLDRRGDARPGLVRLAAGVRAWARRTLRAHVLAGPEEGLTRALLLGDRTGLDARTSEAFRVAGTYHILAISGAQVALVAGLLVGALRRAGLPPLVVALLASGVLAFYSLLVGGDVPVVRAAVMAIVLLLGRALDLDADLANLLGLAALVLLVHRPSNVADVGFQLSFAATLGILLLTPPLLEGVPRLPLRLEMGLGASVAAQATLLPLLAAHFHRLAPAALLLNLVAVPLSGAVLLSGAAVPVAAAFAPVLAPLAGDLTWMLAHVLLRSSAWAGLAPALDRRVPAAAPWALVAHLLGFVLFATGPRRRLGLGLLVLGLAGVVVGPAPDGGDGRLHLAVVDVGQGDCLVVRSPRGRTWLVDAGGSYDARFDLGEWVVGPYLWSQGVRRIDTLMLTHAHPDHVGGVPFLLGAFDVGEVWEGPAPRRDPVYGALDEVLRASGSRRRAVVRGAHADWDGVAVEVRGPRPPVRPPWRTRNDDSLVLSVHLGEVTFLLTGDIEGAGEEAVGPVRAEVLKVPHHGSRSSSTSTFLATTSPLVAVVSAGFRNRFGHPHPEVLERYRARGIRLYRTDRDGTVSLATDGRRIWLRTFRDGREVRVR